ncbi:uncharacterized protein C12orf76 homolog [Prionailurus bengalensis]|uniref:uncharacterized protein C12orf76 homolog n=1 Tax=Prionailurus bengalensis TaxID=37029 RepID=UPI001CA8FE6C|nr:uncharacterized protein C12orf76 homolog [Prionailurus bengalensis]
MSRNHLRQGYTGPGIYGYPGNGVRRVAGSSGGRRREGGDGGEAFGGSELRRFEPGKMLHRVWRWLCFGLGSLLAGQAEAPSPVEPPERSRPYAVLRGQNLVLMGTIFSILLVTVILLAFCVYKPIRRR